MIHTHPPFIKQVYCPFQIKHGGVWNLPFVRLDDILLKEAASEASVNLQRNTENTELQKTFHARKEFLRTLKGTSKSLQAPDSQQLGGERIGGEEEACDATNGTEVTQSQPIPPLKLDFNLVSP